MSAVARAWSSTVLTLCALMLLAAGSRCWQLDTIPPGLFGDEAADGLVAREILAGKRWPIFIEEPEATKWGSREPLYHYLMAAVFAVAGATPATLRLTSALIGVATVPLLYLLCRRVFGTRVAVLAAALLAVSRWHVTISRLGVRAVLAPLWMVLAALAFVRVLERRRRADAAALGVVLGLGLYTYPAVWAVPCALAVPLGIVLIGGGRVRRRRRGALQNGRETVRLVVTTLLAAVLVATPLLIYAAVKPDYVFARAARTAAAVDAPLRDRLQRVLFMLHFRGDANPRHNIPGAAMLDPITGVLVAVGVLIALRRLHDEPVRYGGLLACWLVPLLPSGLSDAAPHALRAAGALPAVSTLAAVGMDRVLPRGRPGVAVGAALLAIVGGWNVRDYFQRWAGDGRVAAAYNRDALEFFRFSAELALLHDVYALPAVYDAPQWRFLDLQPRSHWHGLDARAFLTGTGRDHVLISDRAGVNAVIESLYPGAEVVGRFSVEGRGAGRVYRIPHRQLRGELSAAERERIESALLPARNGDGSGR
jgi:4-amino-4-deoxy-L-arabinose transferase-like glycosyltransferase